MLKQEKLNIEKHTNTVVQNVKAEYQSKMYTLVSSQKEADQKIAEAENLKSQLSDEATKRANKMIKDKTAELQAKFKAKETALVSYVAIFGILTAVVTILSLIRQKTFWGDFRAFWIGFWKIIYSVAVLIGDGFSQIANLCDMIPQHYVAVVAHWI
ncbi:MAG TPA: DUF6040 family protein, partial [Chitinispirillaceae bacterium]|nr:DUF6040 family protein [Chitinispirillaceae bacterium]